MKKVIYQYFRNKYKAYEAFKPFYQREIVFWGNEKNKDAFFSFVQKNPRFILKDCNSSKGTGVEIIDTRTGNFDAGKFCCEKLNSDEEYIAEELIQQADA